MFVKVAAALAISSIIWPGVAQAENFRTASGKVLCAVAPDSTLDSDMVVCQGDFTQPGAQYNVTTTGDGTISWSNANLATENPTIQMDYGQTYQWGHWQIRAESAGTQFTNSRTGHGMFVSIEDVYPF
jgi:hypothetical protein